MRKIRVLIAIFGMDQHEVGAVAVSRLLRDAGMEVVYAGRGNLPPMLVKTALQEGVDVIGVSCHSWEYLFYTRELLGLLREHRLETPVVVGGSIITTQDAKELLSDGVAAAFGPTASTEEIIAEVRRIGEAGRVGAAAGS
jgi:methylmalonyl-CoA mutase C-terminal domain/subunit